MNARMVLTDSQGQSSMVVTNSSGNFQFNAANAGETVIITIFSKRYTFAPQVISLTEDLSGLVFTAR